jgi:cytochrome P450
MQEERAASAAATPSVSSFAFWSQPSSVRASTFAELRRAAPVCFQEPSDFGLGSSARGFWALTRHAEVVQVSRKPDVFRSGEGVGLGDVPIDLLELNASFLVMDPPRHTALRRVVSGAFTPKRVALLQSGIEAEARRIVDEFVDGGGGEVVQGLSSRLPLWTISEMMGVPESLRRELYSAAEAQMASQDPEFAGDPQERATVAIRAAQTMHEIATELCTARRANPGDDILSTLVHSEIDGQPLSDQMLGGIFVLFSTAGNDTTKNTTSHSLKLFADNPAQWRLLTDERSLMATAIEELLRCASPVIHFRRTATADTALAGTRIAQGDAVVMFYESANADEAVFPDAPRFDITRSPNPHVAFGGGGLHFCLGANLARAQLRAVLSRLTERVSSIETGEPEYLVSNFINGIKRMTASVTAR